MKGDLGSASVSSTPSSKTLVEQSSRNRSLSLDTIDVGMLFQGAVCTEGRHLSNQCWNKGGAREEAKRDKVKEDLQGRLLGGGDPEVNS